MNKSRNIFSPSADQILVSFAFIAKGNFNPQRLKKDMETGFHFVFFFDAAQKGRCCFRGFNHEAFSISFCRYKSQMSSIMEPVDENLVAIQKDQGVGPKACHYLKQTFLLRP